VQHEENFRLHYARTLAGWCHNLGRTGTRASPRSARAPRRVWGLYMAGSRLAFERNEIQLHHVLAVRTDEQGTSDFPWRPTFPMDASYEVLGRPLRASGTPATWPEVAARFRVARPRRPAVADASGAQVAPHGDDHQRVGRAGDLVDDVVLAAVAAARTPWRAGSRRAAPSATSACRTRRTRRPAWRRPCAARASRPRVHEVLALVRRMPPTMCRPIRSKPSEV
jgi:hypothetical protein